MFMFTFSHGSKGILSTMTTFIKRYMAIPVLVPDDSLSIKGSRDNLEVEAAFASIGWNVLVIAFMGFTRKEDFTFSLDVP